MISPLPNITVAHVLYTVPQGLPQIVDAAQRGPWHGQAHTEHKRQSQNSQGAASVLSAAQPSARARERMKRMILLH